MVKSLSFLKSGAVWQLYVLKVISRIALFCNMFIRLHWYPHVTRHFTASWPQFTALQHTPQGYIGARGPGFGETSPDNIEKSGAWFGMCRVILRGKYGTCSANTTLQGLKVCKLGLGRASRGKVRGTGGTSTDSFVA